MEKKINNIIISDSLKNLSIYLNNNKFSNLIILLDINIENKCLDLLYKDVPILKLKKTIIIKILSGERYKSLKTCIKIWKIFIKKNIDKKSLLINFGGGVVTDLGGFIASLFKRGINFINVPTTLLGMVDASIGGKNGINFYKYKNEIGVINNPIYTIINYRFLDSLPKKEIYSAFGEILKYGLIYNKKYFNYIKKIKIYGIVNWVKIIYIAVKIKNKIVDKDPKEILGIRKILNFGHTIGHAIESLFLLKKKIITHGEAISLGMICESWISKKVNNLSNKDYKTICKVILSFFKIRKIKKKYFKYILKIIKNDKKNYNNKIYLVLLKNIGSASYNHEVHEKLIIKSIKKMNDLYKKK
ncbi:MAG: 3-dehydroquinate synthase [Candidatus Shikimatogenerans bostrichidophilus]|nr:MAG: 3-dehydroquinate synthase [Candidatus Shikimatogenerans bostrichidophilus]